MPYSDTIIYLVELFVAIYFLVLAVQFWPATATWAALRRRLERRTLL